MSETLSGNNGETAEQGDGGKNEWEKMAENAPAFRGQEAADFVDVDRNSVFSSEEEARAWFHEMFNIPTAEEAEKSLLRHHQAGGIPVPPVTYRRKEKKPEEGGTPTPTIE